MSASKDTKTRILDAAEELFSEIGFDAVPVREIMRRANARLGLMNYYFESKDALLKAVIARRVEILNSARISAIEKFAGTPRSSISRIVDAYIDPYLALMLNKDPGWRNYGRLIAVLAQSSRWMSLTSPYFDDTARVFLTEIRRLRPKVSEKTIIQSFVFSVGAMLNVFSMSGRMGSLSGGSVPDDDLVANVDALKKFVVSGLEGSLVARGRSLRK